MYMYIYYLIYDIKCCNNKITFYAVNTVPKSMIFID